MTSRRRAKGEEQIAPWRYSRTNKSDRAEDADGEEEDGGDEGEDSGDGDADEAEGEQDEPDDGVEEERYEGERPADDQEDAEEQKFDHGVPFGCGVSSKVVVKKRIRR